ncbi:hypothetical protein BJ165DRAFT_1518053 [Panaeolus papilionaceus]|nr:hypothetical protein BJ165DRAFT_1518053 [Panaeolus papilionaceus]
MRMILIFCMFFINAIFSYQIRHRFASLSPSATLSRVWFSFRGSQPSPGRLWVLIIVERHTQSPPLSVFISVIQILHLYRS